MIFSSERLPFFSKLSIFNTRYFLFIFHSLFKICTPFPNHLIYFLSRFSSNDLSLSHTRSKVCFPPSTPQSYYIFLNSPNFWQHFPVQTTKSCPKQKRKVLTTTHLHLTEICKNFHFEQLHCHNGSRFYIFKLWHAFWVVNFEILTFNKPDSGPGIQNRISLWSTKITFLT